MVCQFLSYTVPPDLVNVVLPLVSVFGAIAMAGFVRFSSEFQRSGWRGGWASRLLNSVYFTIIALELWIAIQRLLVLQNGYVEFRDAWLDIPFTLGFALAYILFVERYIVAISQETTAGRLQVAGAALRGFLLPGQKLATEAAAARAFLYVSLFPLVHVVFMALRSYGLLDWALVEVMLTVLALFIFGGFALVYLNHAPEASSFQIKLVGTTLTAVLGIVSGLSWVIGPVYIDAYQNEHRLPSETTLRFEPDPDGSYLVARTSHFFDQALGDLRSEDTKATLPFDFPFFGETYDSIIIHPHGMLGFKEYPIWRDVQHRFGPQPAIFAQPIVSHPEAPNAGLFVKTAPDKVTVTFNDMTPDFGSAGVYRTQVRLYATGVIEIALDAVPDHIPENLLRAHAAPLMLGIVPEWSNREVQPVRFASDLPLRTAPGVGLVELYRLDFLEHLNLVFRPMAVFVIVVSATILLVFPRFYSVNLNEPLRDMIHGVEDIMQGKLDTSIPVAHRDEFGYLASSFNQMAKSQQDLISTLEDKVAERSEVAANLAAQNARLEERHHLARELHDAVSQTLFAANLEADSLTELSKADTAAMVTSAKRLQSLNQDALSEMRLLLAELRPERLLNCPFGSLLCSIADDMGAKYGLSVSLSIENDLCLPDDVQLAFFRVAQEALHNALKHAQTANVDILFDGLETQALLTVKDAGVGFVMQDVGLTSYGLRAMSERLEAIGGQLEIETAPNQGTSITAIWYGSQ